MSDACVVLLGDPIGGLTIVGPFDSWVDAEAWVEDEKPTEAWVIAKLTAPIERCHWCGNQLPNGLETEDQPWPCCPHCKGV